MKVAFLTFPVSGHAYPMSSLARRLKNRGHDVVVIGTPDAAPVFQAAELPFVPYCEKEYPAGSDRERYDRLSKLQGQEALEFTHRTIDEVLRNPEYRENANRLRQAIANTNGLEKAVDLLEEALGLERPL
jgi:zeaxanthin glucosyltransferase